jgi:hypothetical protein
MPSVQITIDIDGTPGTGHARQKLDRVAGQDVGAILSRIAIAHPQFRTVKRTSDVAAILQAVADAVATAEAEE